MLRFISVLVLFAISFTACCTDTPVDEGAEKKLAIEYAQLADSQITIACTEAKWWNNPKATELCTSKDFNHSTANCKSRLWYSYVSYTGSWLDDSSDVLYYFTSQSDPPPNMKLRVPDFCDTTSSKASIRLGCWVYYAPFNNTQLPYDVGQRVTVTHPKYTMSVETLSLPGNKDQPLGLWELWPSNNKVCKRWGELRQALGIPSATK